MLGEVFRPELVVDFDAGVPYCTSHDDCFAEAGPRLANATLLMIPRVHAVGNDAEIPACARANVAVLREVFLRAAPVVSPHVVLVLRGGEVGPLKEDFAYERPYVQMGGMARARDSLATVAARRGAGFEAVELEAMSFADQLRALGRATVLVGSEGAGLAMMLFLPDPAASFVVEVNWATGKLGRKQEFPVIAQHLGIPLLMNVATDVVVRGRGMIPVYAVAVERLTDQVASILDFADRRAPASKAAESSATENLIFRLRKQ